MKKLFTILILFITGTVVSQSSINNCWSFTIGGDYYDENGLMTTDKNKNVFIAGSFESSVDFNPNPLVTKSEGSSGSSDVFVEKLDSNGNFLWVKRFGGSSSEEATQLFTDSDGNVYLVGNFFGSVFFDDVNYQHQITSKGERDVYILKLDSNGNIMWVKSFGGDDTEYVNSAYVDDKNKIYLAGSFGGTSDFSPGDSIKNITSKGFFDFFVSKLDTNGNLIWVQTGGAASWDRAHGVTVDSKGNVIVTGEFYKQLKINFPNGEVVYNGPGQTDVFIEKLDSNGIVQWVKTIGGQASDAGRSVITNLNNEIYISGMYVNKVDFGLNQSPQLLNTSTYSTDIFVLKLDSAGDFIWVKSFGGQNQDVIREILLDKNEDILISGLFLNEVDFDPSVNEYTISTRGSYDVFIQKLSKDGNFQWVKTIGGRGFEDFGSLHIDKQSNLFIATTFSDTVYANSTKHYPVGERDILYQKLSVECLDSNSFPYESTPIVVQNKDMDFNTYNINLKNHFSDFESPANDLIYTFSNGSNIIASITNGVITIEAPANWFGKDTILVKITDPQGLAIFQKIEFIVNSTVGYNEVGKEALSVYPNPFNSLLNINVNGIVTIIDINGKIIKTESVINNKIDFSTIENGLYFIKYNSQTIKILKQ